MMKQFDSSYQFGLSIALAIHILLATVLLIDQSTPHAVTDVAKPVDIIQAVTVDSKQVTEAVNAIKAQEAESKAEKTQEIREARLAKQRELQRLEDVQKQVEKAALKKQEMVNANIEAQKKLKALEVQHLQIAKELAKKAAEAKAKDLAAKASKKKQADLQKAEIEKARREQEKYAEDQEAKEAAEQQARMQSQMNGVVDKYAVLIKQSIAKRWILPQDVNKQASCKVQIHLAASGQVLSVAVIQSSGNPLLDRSVNAAIYKASPLPVPSDPGAFQRLQVINLTLRPEQVLS